MFRTSTDGIDVPDHKRYIKEMDYASIQSGLDYITTIY